MIGFVSECFIDNVTVHISVQDSHYFLLALVTRFVGLGDGEAGATFPCAAVRDFLGDGVAGAGAVRFWPFLPSAAAAKATLKLSAIIQSNAAISITLKLLTVNHWKWPFQSIHLFSLCQWHIQSVFALTCDPMTCQY